MSIFKPLLMLGAIVGGLQPITAQDLDRGALLIDGPTDSTATEFKYRKKWLLVVGIDYRSEDRESDKGVQSDSNQDLPELKNAEDDAKAVRHILVEKFGFEEYESPDMATLLIGNEATYSRISERIGSLHTGGGITEEDCVLVYFSGHGVLQRNSSDNSQHGLLLPVDVKMGEGLVNPGSAIEMDFVVQSLRNCPAKHKLLILDCCHSGAVFRLNEVSKGYERESDENELHRGPFIAKGFQVITASRDNQKASDGRNGHSPFTNALLVALQTTPLLVRQTADERGIFTANRLFETMVPYLRGEGISHQQRGWIGGDLGQLHFIPDPDADFHAESGTPLQRNQLLAVTPTTFGNWWAYEVPWFMPGLRLAILQQNVPSRSTTDELDPKSLLEAAQQAQLELVKSETKPEPVFAMRYRHLEKLLKTNTGESRRLVVREIVKDLIEKSGPQQNSGESTVPEEGIVVLGAEDYHYLGVLQHLLDDFKEAEANYAKALTMYQSMIDKKTTEATRFLRALCSLDAAVLSISRNHYGVGRERIKMARNDLINETGLDEAPWPFRVFALCREADAYRGEGRYQLSHYRMEEAVHVLTRFDAQESTLLFANTMKVRAWAHMIGWDFKNAEKDFDAADTMLQAHKSSRFESEIDLFHVRHGKAMIERYQGRDGKSLEQYRILTEDIANRLANIDGNDDQEILNYSEVRSLLYDRLVNSLERQADCSLFGGAPDFAEAADDYRRAIHECRHISQEKQSAQLIDLLYRRAVAVCLHAVSRNVDETTTTMVLQEFELAQEICNEAAELLKKGIEEENIVNLSFKTKAVETLARVCLKLRPESSAQVIERDAGAAGEIGSQAISIDSEPALDFTGMFSELSRDPKVANPNACDRDELERLMFFYRTLLEYRVRFGIARYDSLKHVSQLLAYCRSACRLETPDPQLLAYLRPYYDAAFTAHLELLPGHTKELIEISYEATHGTPYLKPGIVQPLLAMYVARGRCHVLVDARGSASQTLTLDEITSIEDLISASDPESAKILLPDKIRRILRLVEEDSGYSKIELRWRDPVLGIGVEPGTQAGAGMVSTKRPNLDSGAILGHGRKESKFPMIFMGISGLETIDDRNPLCVDSNTGSSAEASRELVPTSLPGVHAVPEAGSALP